MIDEFSVKNTVTNTSLTFGKDVDSRYIIENVDWGSAKAKHNSYSSLTSVGEVITSTDVTTRTIAITGRVCPQHSTHELIELHGTGDIAAIEAYRLAEIEEAKSPLSQLFNPEHMIRITAGHYFIEGKPTASMKFSSKEAENNDIYCKFTVSLECPKPLFYYTRATQVPLSGVTGGFHFPLVLKKNKGIHFGIKQLYQLVVVDNTSDVEIGGIIYMRATGTVENPKLTNVYTQDAIQIKKTLSADEVVKIDTVNRKVYGSVDGGITYELYFQYWDFDNKWLQFQVGKSLFGFTADDDTYRALDIWIEINKGFYSMEGQ